MKSAAHDPAPRRRRLLLPERGIYSGAYIEAGDSEDDVTLEKIDGFEELVGKHQAIVASSSYWGEQTFPDANVRLIFRHGSLPLLYWSPWDRPYEEGRGPDRFSLTSIIAGEHDAYLDMWGDQARAFGEPLLVCFANEMNGSWFPWSGIHYGADALVPDGITGQFVYFPVDGRYDWVARAGPRDFPKPAYHVVDRIRSRGASNVQFVFHVMNFSDPNDSWNVAAKYYPGPEYCDWLGMSLYGSQFPADAEWAPFAPLLEWPYQELCALDSKKPIMLCEWGVAELPQLGDKAQWFRDGFRMMQEPRFSRLKAIVYWNERWENSEGDNAGKYSNLRVNSAHHRASKSTYRRGLSHPSISASRSTRGSPESLATCRTHAAALFLRLMNALCLPIAILLLAGSPLLLAADPPPASSATATTVQFVTPDQAEKLLKEKKDIVVLDVRSAGEFEGGHIAGAQNLDYFSKDFKEKLAALDRSKTYLVHCASGNRSSKACALMEQQNFGTVYHLNTGIKGWEGAGKPVTK